MTQQTSFRDIKKLSAYLDKQLSKSAQARLEARLAEHPELQEILLDMRQARALLKQTPRQRVPRNFTLTPKMVGMRPPVPRSVPIFRLASITAAILLFISFSFNFLAPIASAPGLAAARYQSEEGMGGGCDTSIPGNCGDVAMEAPVADIDESPQEAITSEPITEMSIAPAALYTATPDADLQTTQQPTQIYKIIPTNITAPESPPSEIAQTQPVLDSLQIGLILLVIGFGSIALIIRQINIQRWRKRL